MHEYWSHRVATNAGMYVSSFTSADKQKLEGWAQKSEDRQRDARVMHIQYLDN
jgi:hypothetical protein